MQKSVLAVKIVVHDEFIGKVWYLIRLTEGTKDKFYLKRYEDFQELHWNLDAVLRSLPKWGNEADLRVLPELPELGRWGIMQKMSLMGMGDWADRFRESLQHYLDKIMSQVADLEDEPILRAFFGKSPIPPVQDDVRPALLIRFRGLAERARSFGGRRSQDSPQTVRPGMVVTLVNLRNATQFNGALARVVSIDEAKDHVEVQLEDGRKRTLAISNVRLVEAAADDSPRLPRSAQSSPALSSSPRKSMSPAAFSSSPSKSMSAAALSRDAPSLPRKAQSAAHLSLPVNARQVGRSRLGDQMVQAKSSDVSSARQRDRRPTCSQSVDDFLAFSVSEPAVARWPTDPGEADGGQTQPVMSMFSVEV